VAGVDCAPADAWLSSAASAREEQFGTPASVPQSKSWRRARGYLEGLEDDGKDGGLICVCLNAGFQRQFEVVQAQWCDDGTAFRLGSDKHCLLGDSQGMGEVTIQGHPAHFARAQPLVLLTRGCVYLLMPRVGALRDLPGR
jgi:hypothetical protein